MAGKGTRHRFELSRLEIAGVVVSAVAGLFVVFMLGIYAGRGMTDRRLDGGEQIVRLPVAPAAEQTPAAEERLTFYDTLGQDERAGDRRDEPGGDVAKAEAPKPAGEASAASRPEPAASAEPSREEARKPATGEKPEAEKAAAAVAKAPAEEPRRAAAPTPSPAALAKSARSPAPPATARVAVALAPATPRSQAKGEWSVQVSASRDPRTADAVLRRLRAKGYDAYVLRVRRRGETFYRVRVGHYASIEDAQQVVSRLRREPGVPEAFVASD